MVVLGIDPGTHCGWAILADGKRIASGTWDLSARRHEGGGMRFVRLRTYLAACIASGPTIEAVAYEEVRRHMGTDSAHVYGGIVATLATFCEELKLPYRGIPVATVKRHATGKGNADKKAMVQAARMRFGLGNIDDNEADALFIASALLEELTPLKSLTT